MDLSSIWPSWGSKGDKPSDGKDYEQGDNVAAGSLDYLWYYIKDTFEKVETALSNKADDPHDNASHSENYITSGDVDEGAPDPHDNTSHNPDFLPSSDYTPVTTVEGETSALDIDITGDADTVDGQDASQLVGEPLATVDLTSSGGLQAPLTLSESNNGEEATISAAQGLGIFGVQWTDNHPASAIGGSGLVNINSGISFEGTYFGQAGGGSLIELQGGLKVFNTLTAGGGIEVPAGGVIDTPVIKLYDDSGDNASWTFSSLGGDDLAILQNGNRVAKLDGNGNLDIAGVVNENASL